MIVVERPEDAEHIVEQHKKSGYDCIKLYTHVSRDVYRAILKAAAKFEMPVAGHVPTDVGLDTALALHQSSIEHLTGYMGAIESDNPLHREADLKTVKEEDIPLVAEATARAQVWNCPTLVVQQNYAAAKDYEELSSMPELKYVPPVRLAMWNPNREKRFQGTDFQAAKRGIEMLMKITKELHDAGAKILLGSDAPTRFVVPGFAVHRELINLVNSGLSPYEALISRFRHCDNRQVGRSAFVKRQSA
jgi:imidazolonepropionase-like amidohydrolase